MAASYQKRHLLKMHLIVTTVVLMLRLGGTGAFLFVSPFATRRHTQFPLLFAASSKIVITESDFAGAGVPRPDLPPEEIPTLLFTALRHNDFPESDSGLRSVWAFTGDTMRHIFQHNVTDFIESAHDTARQFPTSFYGNALYGQEWEMETPLNRVGGDGNNDKDDDDGWIATQVMKTISSDGRLRRWQWELRKNRRPPDLDCWYVESIGSSDRKGEFEAE